MASAGAGFFGEAGNVAISSEAIISNAVKYQPSPLPKDSLAAFHNNLTRAHQKGGSHLARWPLRLTQSPVGSYFAVYILFAASLGVSDGAGLERQKK